MGGCDRRVVAPSTTKGTKMKKDNNSAAFLNSLLRNNKEIRTDRAREIEVDTKVLFKRTVEDLSLEINRIKRQRNNMLDLSPTNSHSLRPAADFDAKHFIETDLVLGLKIRNLTIRLNVARKRYQELFGKPEQEI